MIADLTLSPYVIPLLVSRPSIKRNSDKANRIIEIVCDYYSVPRDKLSAKSRKHGYVYPRQWAMFFLCKKTTMSLSAIGQVFGGRDHTTVIHSRELVSTQLSSVFENDFKDDYPILEELMYNINK